MDDAKYVCIDTAQAGPGYFLFPKWFEHAEFKRRVAPHAEVLSAGFVSFGVNGPTCHGKSTSLGVGTRQGDTRWLRLQLGIED